MEQTLGSTSVASASNTITPLAVVALNNTKAILFYEIYGSGAINAIVIVIVGNTFGVGTALQVPVSSAGTSATPEPSAILIAEDKVMFSALFDASSSVYGLIFEASGATLSVGTRTQLASTGVSSSNFASAASAIVSQNVAFVCWTAQYSSSARRIDGVIATVDGLTITTFTTNTVFRSSTYTVPKGLSCCLIGSNKVLVAFFNGDSSSDSYQTGIKVFFVPLTIDGTTFSVGEYQSPYLPVYTSRFRLFPIGNGKVLFGSNQICGVATLGGSSLIVNITICGTGETVGIYNGIGITGRSNVFGAIAPAESGAYIVGCHAKSGPTVGVLGKNTISWSTPTNKRLEITLGQISASTASQIAGALTKTACTTTTPGKVWVLGG